MFSNMWEKVKNFFMRLPGITISVLGITLGIFTLGFPLLEMAVMAALAVVLSLVFVLWGAPKEIRNFVVDHAPKYGWIVDAAITCVLTIVGFQMSVTMGLVGMLVGFNLSALLELMRRQAAKNKAAEVSDLEASVVDV